MKFVWSTCLPDGSQVIWLLVIMNDDLIPLFNKAYFFLKFRPRSVKEVREYLYKKVKTTHWSREAADKVIEKLKEQELIDDKKFIDWFVRNRTTLKPKGEKMLRRELLQKGINKELLDNFFSKNAVDEESLALQILEKRWPRFSGLSSQKRFEKACRFLLSRGFNYDICKKTIEYLKNKE